MSRSLATIEISIHGQGEYIRRYIPHFVNLNANIIIDRSGRKLSSYNPSQSITVIDITYNPSLSGVYVIVAPLALHFY